MKVWLEYTLHTHPLLLSLTKALQKLKVPLGLMSALFIFSLLSFNLPQKSSAQSALEDFSPFMDDADFFGSSDEEKVINFFHSGRLLQVELIGGYRSFVGDLKKHLDPSLMFGLNLTYFFDHQLALSFGFWTGSHVMFANLIPGYDLEGSQTLTNFNMHLRYYLPEHSLQMSIAKLNPYFIGGPSIILRQTRDISQPVLAGQDASVSFDAGFGLEYHFSKNSYFLGVQGLFQYTNFPDENTQVPDPVSATQDTGVYFRGDVWLFKVNMGYNF